MHRIDIDAYFSRIAYAGPRAPTLEVLRQIVLRHVVAIPFESLNPFAGLPVLLDPAALEQKMVQGRRGGYCFEQNLLLWNVLQQLGFEVSGLAARVVWNSPSSPLPRSHMLLRIELNGTSYLVDVGFGGLTLTGVLNLIPDIEQTTPHEAFRLLHVSGEYVMQANVRGEWRSQHHFDLQPQLPVDYEPVNWYLSTYPQSRFVTNLVAARSEPGRRYALLNRELAIHELRGETHRRVLQDAAELARTLQEIFLIDLPADERIERALARLFAEGS